MWSQVDGSHGLHAQGSKKVTAYIYREENQYNNNNKLIIIDVNKYYYLKILQLFII